MENTTFSGFGDLLKAWRKRRSMTQKELATRLGVHRNTIGTWENGDFLPESKTIVLELAHQLRLDNDETRRLLEASLTALSPYWHVPYQRNPFFTGREDVLLHLHDVLAQGQTALLSQSYALSGLGGIGKTQTAIEYAYRYADDYTAVFWINAETPETIIPNILVIANMLNLLEKQDQDQEKVVTAVMRWFSSHKDWLLIFDNTEDPAQIKRFLPGTRSGSLLFTSRRQSLGLSTQILTLERISLEEGARFLTQRARLIDATKTSPQLSSTETTLVNDIVGSMDGLPLALDQAGAYIEATKCGLSAYLHLFQASQVRLLDERDAHDDHPLSVTKTFALVFEQIEKRHPEAAEILTVCAYLAPEEIPDMFFIQGAAFLGPTFEKLMTDPLAFYAALKTLLIYSVVQRNSIDATLSIHRLVQAVLKAQISTTMQQQWIERMLHTMAQVFPSYEDRPVGYWETCEKLLAHALTCISLNEHLNENESQKSQVTLISLMNHIASYLSRRARYTEAEVLFQRALLLGKQKLEPEHFLLSEVLHELALSYSTQGRNKEAEPLFLQSLQIREQTRGSKHPTLATPLDNLANLYYNQGKYQQAETLYQRALAVLEKSSGLEKIQAASTRHNLAILYIERGKYQQAELLLQQALSIWQQRPQSDDLMLAYPFCNLALCYSEQGKYQQATSFYQQALHIWELKLGPKHPQVAHPLNGLAVLHYQQGLNEQAEIFCLRALSIREQALRPNHNDVATTKNVLAAIYKDLEKYQQAESLLQQALHIWEQNIGFEHTQVARALNNLANLYIKQGKYQQAEPLYLRALHIRKQAHGPDHPYLAYPLNGLANCYFKLEKYQQAEPLYQDALRIRETRLGQHPDTAETCSDFATFQEAMNKNQEALSLYQRALFMREQILGAEHTETQATRGDYLRILHKLEQANKIERFFPSSKQAIQAPDMSHQANPTVEQSRANYPACPTCQRNDSVVQSGVNRTGTQRFRCRSCQRYFTPGAKPRGYDVAVKARAQALTRAGVSSRDVARQLNIHHSTVSLWTKEDQK